MRRSLDKRPGEASKEARAGAKQDISIGYLMMAVAVDTGRRDPWGLGGNNA